MVLFYQWGKKGRVRAWCMNGLILSVVCELGRDGPTAVPFGAAQEERGEEKPSPQGAQLLDGAPGHHFV